MNIKNHNNSWKIIFLFYTAGIATILYLAYSNGIPKQISIIPYYDLMGHFLLYGIWSYLVYRALNRSVKYGIPIGPAIITIITIIEELLQYLSSNRTSSIIDLLFSLTGIWLAILIDKSLEKKRLK